jgi:hypothetical protein
MDQMDREYFQSTRPMNELHTRQSDAQMTAPPSPIVRDFSYIDRTVPSSSTRTTLVKFVLPTPSTIESAESPRHRSSPIETYHQLYPDEQEAEYLMTLCGIRLTGLELFAALCTVLWIGIILPLYLWWGLRDESRG